MKSVLIVATLLLAVIASPQANARPGYRCDASRHRYGFVCPLLRPRPLGVLCHCVPPGPPGYGYGRPIRGVVIP